MIEPSDAERSAWPDATADYVADSEARIAKLERDCWHLVAMIEWLSEATGEGLKLEDAALLDQIRAELPASRQEELPGSVAASGNQH